MDRRLSSTLIVDSIVFALKLAFSIWWIIETFQESERWSSRPDPSDMDNLHGIGQFFWYCASISLTVWVPLRWVANFCQYRKEKIGRAFFCSTICWFVLGALHLIYCGGIIMTDWCTLTNETYPACKWPKTVGISFLFWETLMFGFMATFNVETRPHFKDCCCC